tara:strand:- start:2198 stop:2455 length:258 start_codon:yes stop_codon:yes gene_type:complete
MVEIEEGIKIKSSSKYQEYYSALESMKHGQSFLVDNIIIVDAVRSYGHKNSIGVKYRRAGKKSNSKYRIWRYDGEETKQADTKNV